MIKKIRQSRGFTLVELMIVVAIVGVLAALAIVGVKKYLTNSKTTEARGAIGAMSKLASAAWSRELMPGVILPEGGTVGGANTLCATSTAVPSDPLLIKGMKYQAKTAPGSDYATGDSLTGWKCLGYTMDAPQYFQYQYTANANLGFKSIAKGDLNGDGTNYSEFSREAEIRNGQVVLSPAILEVNPEE